MQLAEKTFFARQQNRTLGRVFGMAVGDKGGKPNFYLKIPVFLSSPFKSANSQTCLLLPP
jgi:hypothetical protein